MSSKAGKVIKLPIDWAEVEKQRKANAGYVFGRRRSAIIQHAEPPNLDSNEHRPRHMSVPEDNL